MNELTAPVIRFRHAAEAIGVTKKTLRNWLARGQVQLDAASEGWSEFSRLDLVRLALTAELVRYGVGIIPAFYSARSQVDGATYMLAGYNNTPAAALPHAFKGRHCFMQKTADDKTHFFHAKPGEGPPENWDGAGLLIINMEDLANKVINRLVDALDHDPTDPDEEWARAGIDTDTEQALRNLTETIKKATAGSDQNKK